jgi:hypothetical protein
MIQMTKRAAYPKGYINTRIKDRTPVKMYYTSQRAAAIQEVGRTNIL